MFSRLFKHFAGRHYRKFVDKCKPIVAKINEIEKQYQSLSDEQLRAKTQEFKERYTQGETIDSLLPEAFAVVKNTARRLLGKPIMVCDHHFTWDMVHYDVQLIGGIALHQNKIAEMATGEGKTLVATLPLYLNALTGKNCQLITVNDYLVRRDAEWMGYIYKSLGLTVGHIQNGMEPEEKKAAYGCDITYGTASEFGFDYLRDNGMATRAIDQVQRNHFYCIIDEADSILIDEARTPLIISGPADNTREAPFFALKPTVESLSQLQTKLCNRLAAEAKNLSESPDKIKDEALLEKLLLVKLGAPKNKLFLKMMEDGNIRKHFDRFQVEMHSDFNRDRLFKLKESLYFTIDEKQHQADLTELGRKTLRPGNDKAFVLEDLPSLFSELDKRNDLSATELNDLKKKAEESFAKTSEEIHCISQLLRAYCLYERDVEYVIQDGKVVIIDLNTGRAMSGRRWSEGLHQAVEAKENVNIEKETKTYATITLQNYFRLYEKLAGMTGTAETEAQEFFDIYKLTVVQIPTHKPNQRKDLNDVIFKTRREKYNTVIKDIENAHRTGQPVLVGTTSVDNSEVLSKMLKRSNIPHSVLNAKYHEQEADIISRAGQKHAVTIATNMAGRGTDIKLGDGVQELGGLFVLGTERHDSRRVDRQLKGRCARQGDPGASKFVVSLEDNLMRLFASGGLISRILEKTFTEGEELAHPLLNKSIESAQKKVEQQNYAIRKRLLQFDDVLNKQRTIIYGLRNEAIHSETPKNLIFELLKEELDDRFTSLQGEFEKDPSEAATSFVHWLNTHFPISLTVQEIELLKSEALIDHVFEKIVAAYEEKERIEDASDLKNLERFVVIRAIDQYWQDHLTEMEELRRSVSLRSYGQKDPLNEYKNEAFAYFEELMKQIRNNLCVNLFRSATNLVNFQHMLARLSASARTTGPEGEQGPTIPTTPQHKKTFPKISIKIPHTDIGRNDLCPCGSGKKYKKCCGATA